MSIVFALIMATAGNQTVARCPMQLVSGQIVNGEQAPMERGHSVTVKNGAQNHAFVKVRDLIAKTSILLYVERGKTGVVGNLLNGIYELSFAFGGRLAGDCLTVINPTDVQKFPGSAKLITTEDTDGYVVPHVSYTLFTVRNGNTRSKKIPVSEFNRD